MDRQFIRAFVCHYLPHYYYYIIINGSQEDICEIEIPDTIPKNIAPEVRPNKDKIIKEHCSRFSYTVLQCSIFFIAYINIVQFRKSSSYGSYGT